MKDNMVRASERISDIASKAAAIAYLMSLAGEQDSTSINGKYLTWAAIDLGDKLAEIEAAAQELQDEALAI